MDDYFRKVLEEYLVELGLSPDATLDDIRAAIAEQEDL